MSYCDWARADGIEREYHDSEWGVPLHDDRLLFEFLMLESLQCGLSWQIIMKKRAVLQSCFDGFDFDRISAYTVEDTARIMSTPQMIKSPRKIAAVISNARNFKQIRAEYGSFAAFLWHYTDGKTVLYDRHAEGYIPVSNDLSARISKDLKKRGFKYLGEVTVYSFLQACGVICDHDKNCPRYKYITENFPVTRKKRRLEKQVSLYGSQAEK